MGCVKGSIFMVFQEQAFDIMGLIVNDGDRFGFDIMGLIVDEGDRVSS